MHPSAYIARAIEGNYPHYRQVIPHEFLADATIPETQRPALISWLRSLDGKGDSVRLTWKKPGHLTLMLRDSASTAAQIHVPVTGSGCASFPPGPPRVRKSPTFSLSCSLEQVMFYA